MKEILESICNDKRIIELSMGKIRPFSEYSGWEYYGSQEVNLKMNHPQPPLFIPIIIDYNSTPVSEGIIKHWFSNRPLSFGYMDFGNLFQIGESATNADQYIKGLVFDQFVEQYNSSITDEFLELSKQIDLTDHEVRALMEVSQRKEDNTACFLPSYIENPPLNCVQNKYSYQGNFPTNDRLIIGENIMNASYFEIFQKEWIGYSTEKKGFSFFKKKSKFQALDNIPEWLRPEINKHEWFEKYISSGEFNKAWLIINGPGFNPIEVGERLQRLKEFSDEKAYHLWADFWCDRYGDMDSFIFI